MCATMPCVGLHVCVTMPGVGLQVCYHAWGKFSLNSNILADAIVLLSIFFVFMCGTPSLFW